MYKLSVHIVGVLALLVASKITLAVDRESSEQVIIEITLSENASSTGEKKVLAEPTVAVTIGRPFSFHVGGELNTRKGGEALEIGTRVRGIVNEHQGDSLLVALKLAVGHGVMDAQTPDTELVRTETLDLRTTMIVGQKKRIDCGRSEVLEIQLKPIPAGDDELSGAAESR